MLPHLKSPTNGDASSSASNSLPTEGNNNDDEHYCASERLRRKVKNEFKRRRKYSLNEVKVDDNTEEPKNIISDNRKNSFNKIMEENLRHRNKRWLPDEVCVLYFV